MPDGSCEAAIPVVKDDPAQSSHVGIDSYRTLVEYSLSGILVHRDHRIIYVNEAWARIYGMTREQAVQLDSVEELMHPDDRERVVGYFYQRQRGESVPEVYDFRIIRGDGEIRTLQMYVFLIDWDGEVAACATVIDVTLERERERATAQEYKQVEREIALISQAVRQSSDGLVICDASQSGFPIIFANPAFMSITGYSSDELIGSTCGMLQGRDTSEETRGEIARCTAEGVDFYGTILNYRKDGKAFWNRLSIAPVKSEHGELTHFVATQRDITKQVELNQELLLTRRALDQAYDRIGVVDHEFRYIYVNEALRKRFGKTREELIGVSIPELVGEEVFRNGAKPFLMRARRGEVVSSAASMPSTEGKSDLIEYSAAPHYDDNGEIVGVTIVSRDRTEEHEAREALAENELRFRDFASLGADVFFEANVDGDIVWMSDGMSAWLNADLSGAQKPNLRRVLNDGISSEDANKLTDCINAGHSFHVEHRSDAKTGGVRIMDFHGQSYERSSGGRFYRGIGRDLTDQRRAEEQLEWQATHDDLTGLISRREFSRQIRARLDADGLRQFHSLMFLDLDHLKVVNDSSGHAAGDRLLLKLTEFLRASAGSVDAILARVGGDEFALFVSGLSEKQAEQLANKIVSEAGRVQLRLAGQIYSISLSIGVVHLSGVERSLEESLACADVACYQAKRLGRNQVAVYRDNDESLLYQRRVNRMESEIRSALEHDRFELHLQPIVSLSTPVPTTVKYEVLIRMRDASNNLVMPNDFIDSAEAYGLITEVDKWVTRETLSLITTIPEGISLSINLSGKSLADTELADEIGHYMRRNAVDGSRLCFEITETTAIRRRDAAIELIERLHGYGCRVSLDDFGSGLSSFRYLKDFDIDEIKIDGSFIMNLNDSPDDQVIVNAIVDIAGSFGMSVVAEGVETAATYEILRAMGIDYGQGYYFGRPTLAKDVIESQRVDETVTELRKLA